MKVATAKTLSEAFLKVRDYLWDGTGDYAQAFPKQECICLAASLAGRDKVITLEHRNMIQHIMQERLYPYASVTTYVRGEHNVDKPSARDIQEYRHAWLIELSKEFADGTANP